MSRSRLSGFVALFTMVICTGGAGANAQAGSTKISPDLAAYSSSGQAPVVIQYRNQPTSLETALISLLGGVIRLTFSTLHALVVNIPVAQLNQIAADSNVTYISLDRVVSAREAVNITAAEYTTEPINAPAVWSSGYVGTNVGVALIDSGVTPVSDLAANPLSLPPLSLTLAQLLEFPNEDAPYSDGRIVYSQNFVQGESDALDHFGHGTHVAGLIAGNGAASAGSSYFRSFQGVAPNANIINLRVLDENGAGTDSAVMAAINRAIALRQSFNIRVINLSLSRPIYESYTLDPLCQAVEAAWKAGIVVVVAAGNDGRNLNLNAEGYGTINSPGNDPYALTVGAMRTMETPGMADDLIASYSSKGPSFIDHVIKPDIVAPGNLVTSLQYSNDSLAVENPTFVTLYSFYQTNGSQQPSSSYFPLSGTSMATGVTSGAVADVLQAAPGLTPDKVKALVMLNGDRNYFPPTSSVIDDNTTYNANYDVFTIGAGYLDVAKTISAAMVNNGSVPAGTAMSPIAIYNATTNTITAAIDPSSLWKNTGAWSAASVYGNQAFISSGSDSDTLWGTTPLWDNDDPNGSTALWGEDTSDGTTALWGKGTPEGSTALWGKSGPSDASAQYAQ